MRQGLDRYFINYYYGSNSVASYSLAYNFAGLIMMLGTALNSTMSVYIYKELEKSDQKTKQKLFRLTWQSILFFLLFTLTAILAVYLFIMNFLPKYIDSIPYIIPLSFMGFFQCIYYLFVNYLFYFNKTKGLMGITFSVSLFHVLLVYFFIKYSSLLSAYIGLFSTFLICIFVVIFSNKTYPLFKEKA
jgi:O-antigen/teichoic acid export membrane protein